MTLLARRLEVTFRRDQSAGTANFPGTTSNTVTLKGLRVAAKIANAGGASMPHLQLAVYGMQLEQMNSLSTLGQDISLIPRNEVLVSAGDESAGAMTTVFVGNIIDAFVDFNTQGDVPFRVEGYGLGALAVLSAKPQSFTGSVDVASVIAGLAIQMGKNFQNNGVTARLSNQYLYGSPRAQALKLVQNANIEWNSGEGDTVAIWPKTGSRANSGKMPVISPATGMVGYPTFTRNGLEVRTLFNPSITFGALAEVQSSIKAACQTVKVMGLDHDLSAQVPKGPWFSTIRGYNPSNPLPVLKQ